MLASADGLLQPASWPREGVAARLNLSITRPYGCQIPQTRAFFVRTPHDDTLEFCSALPFDAKMATPETFSETGSDATMYEKVCSQRPAWPDVLTSRTAGD